MKKTGIISLYHQNKNYGGLLQAYALTAFLKKLGFDAEQISFKKDIIAEDHLTLEILFRKLRRKLSEPVKKAFAKDIYNNISSRIAMFKEFEKSIPHSPDVYTRENIIDCIYNYDAFITGSDQVWNLAWYNPEYFLNFVPSDKRKISYAASMPSSQIPQSRKNTVYNHLIRFDAISVREKETVQAINKLLNSNTAKHVLDPTLLLERNDWDKICGNRKISDKYIFCYFLGRNRKMRKTASAFAKKMNLKIVTLPHLCDICFSDLNFGDEQIYDLSPNDFISLIKNAEYVITDSFHAAVFSNIYQVKHFVFSRTDLGSMDSRITNLLELFDEKERFCFDKKRADMKYLIDLKDRQLNNHHPLLDKAKMLSVEFLQENLDI
ncbi:MAG: polysaccharide pyruvyl transferase family protein [Clostridia bacterium]